MAGERQPLARRGAKRRSRTFSHEQWESQLTGRLICIRTGRGRTGALGRGVGAQAERSSPELLVYARLDQPYEVLDALELVELCAFPRFCS